MKKIVTPRVCIMMLAVMSALMPSTLAKAQRVVSYADTTQTAVDEESFQRWNIVVRGGAGYDQISKDDNTTSGYSSTAKAGFTYKVSVGAEFRATERFSALAGIEMNQRRHRLESNYGGLTGSSDFSETTKYTVKYIAFPISVAYDIFKNDFPLYLGVSFNIPMKGTRKWDSNSGSSGITVSGNSESDIPYENLNTVPELRFGCWDRNAHWGLEVNCGLKDAYNNTTFRKYYGMTAYVCF